MIWYAGAILSLLLALVFKLWGDGWVVRQAVSLVPASVDLAEVIGALGVADAGLVGLVRREIDLRAHRGDADWWRNDRKAATTDLDLRTWLFSILTTARAQVVVGCAVEIDAVAGALTPKHFRSLEAALKAFAYTPLKREVSIRDALRLGKVSYSALALWLLRYVVGDTSVEQIDKKLVSNFADLLVPGMGDRRDLLRIVGETTTVKIESLKGTREVVPSGAWAGDIKLGAVTGAKAKEILTHPDEWPVEIVGRAIQQASANLNRLPSIASVAEANRWFQVDV